MVWRHLTSECLPMSTHGPSSRFYFKAPGRDADILGLPWRCRKHLTRKDTSVSAPTLWMIPPFLWRSPDVLVCLGWTPYLPAGASPEWPHVMSTHERLPALWASSCSIEGVEQGIFWSLFLKGLEELFTLAKVVLSSKKHSCVLIYSRQV